MIENCPLCTILQRETPILETKNVFLISTKNLKGHVTRVMCVSKRHTTDPSFEEESEAYALILSHMQKVMEGKEWYLVASTYASIPQHFHIMSCDPLGTPSELELLSKTPKVKFPLFPKKILIGIPTFNEEKTIFSIILASKHYGDVMVVDDGSTDKTREMALFAHAFVTGWNKNKGYGCAIAELFDNAKINNDDILITLDADGQHDPSQIPSFLQALENGADMVIGNRFLQSSKTPGYRKLGIKLLSVLEHVGDSQCGFRAYNRHAIESLSPKEKGMGVSLELLDQARQHNLKIAEIPCSISYNNIKHDHHPLLHFSSLIESFLWLHIWKKPLTYIGLPGALILFTGILASIQMLDLYVQFKTFVFSWTILSFSCLFLGILLLISSSLLYLFKRSLEEIK